MRLEKITTLTAIRAFFVILCAVGGWAMADLFVINAQPPVPYQYWYGAGIGLIIGAAMIWVDNALKGVSLRGFSAATFGLALGGLVSWLLGTSPLLSFIGPKNLDGTLTQEAQQVRLGVQIALFLVCAYLGMVMALRGKDEFNLLIPYVKFTPTDTFNQLLVVDTSVIIDGRIADICETGFIEGTLIVPRFVLRELQYIADSADPLKRARGRRGLDMLARMQKNQKIEVKIHENEVPEVNDVDAKLVLLGKMLNAKVITNDYNLNKIAELQKVHVLNINDLANAIRAVVLPGEELSVRLVKEGKESDQAVAYLPDGTMIVCNQARRLIGQQALIVVSSILQTSAGRMVFAELKNNMVLRTDRAWQKREGDPAEQPAENPVSG